MHGNWKITIEAWPHQTGEGQAKDQAACGEREHVFIVKAAGFEDAARMAALLQQGMKTNPRLWQAEISSVHIARTPAHVLERKAAKPASSSDAELEARREGLGMGDFGHVSGNSERQ